MLICPRYHPELVELRRIIAAQQEAQAQLAKKQLQLIGSKLSSLAANFPRGSIENRVRFLRGGCEAGLERPLEIVSYLRLFAEKSDEILARQAPTEKDLLNVVTDFSGLLGGLIELESGQPHSPCEPMKQRLQKLSSVHNKLRTLLLENQLFLESNALELQDAVRSAQRSLKAAVTRVEECMVYNARVVMSTIGSSHKLPSAKLDDCDDDGSSDLVNRMQCLDVKSEEKLVLIFDEAGCIPSYELIGLTQLARHIDAIVAVGDKHQLPPYNPQQSNNQNRAKTSFRAKSRQQINNIEPKIESILDASGRGNDDPGKIYHGDYKTHSQDGSKGFILAHVPFERGQEKYMNKNEVAFCVDLVQKLLAEGMDNIMVLTPYKKQQRELQFQFKREGLITGDREKSDIPILTIDQCQGQEADYVVWSLVQRPTRFLDKHRMNVALSRVRKRLYMLTDKEDLRQASLNQNWECNLIAQDLLDLASGQTS